MSEQKRTKVLIIDDEAAVRRMLRGFLEKNLFCVVEAKNGRVGLEVFQHEHPDIILLDLFMPEISGLEVLRKVKEVAPDTPIIVVSGGDVLDDVFEALHLGAWDYILKPIPDITILLHSIKKAKERVRLIRENSAYQEHLEEQVKARTLELIESNEQLKKEINERKLTEKALRASEEKFSTTFRSSPNAIAIVNVNNGCIVDVNDNFLKMCGHKREKVIGNNATGLDLCIQSEYNRFTKFLIRDGRVRNLEIRLYHKSGKAMEGLMSAELIDLEGGPYYIAILNDISHIKRIETQLRQAQKMEAIGSLAGGIAHDFNNILSAIVGYSELALLDASEDSSVSNYLQEVLRAGNRAKELVQQILTFSRQTEQELKPLQPGLVIREALKLLRASLPATVEIRQIIGSDAIIMGDPTQIHQILMNLCTNAGHAMQEKGGVLEVKLQQVALDPTFPAVHPKMEPGDYVLLSVSDTGNGIPDALIDRIFDPFFTTKKKSEGTGLGLSVVHGIVKSYGGAITVDSVAGKGTTFHIYLPVIKRTLMPVKGAEAEIPKGTERILFIDDEQTIVDIGKQILESLEYDVTTRTSSVEALELFKAQPDRFDLVISDMTMPYMTGDELAKELSEIRADIPIILCTGFSSKMTEDKAKTIGVKALVTKPVLIRDLAVAVRKVLDKTYNKVIHPPKITAVPGMTQVS